jgi:hypothetical protein
MKAGPCGAHSAALRGLLGLALCAALAACSAAPRVPSAPRAIGATATPSPAQPGATPAPTAPAVLVAGLGGGQTVTVALGETVSLGVEGASLSFDDVVEDSRCPANAQCLWQGRVVVSGHVTVGGQSFPFTLGTLTGFEDAPASFAAGPYTLRIASVEPYPDTPEGLPQDVYVLTLELGQNS